MICGADGPNSFTLLPEALVLSSIAVSPTTVTVDQKNELFSFVFTIEGERRSQTFSCSFNEVFFLKASTIEPYFHVFSMKLKSSASMNLFELMNEDSLEVGGFDPDIVLTLCLSESAFDIIIGICQQSILYCDVTDAHVFLTSLGDLYSLLLYKKEDPDLDNEETKPEIISETLDNSLQEELDDSSESNHTSVSQQCNPSPVSLESTAELRELPEPSSSASSPRAPEMAQQHMISSTIEVEEVDSSSKCPSSRSSSSSCMDSEIQDDGEDQDMTMDMDDLHEEPKDWSIAHEVQEPQKDDKSNKKGTEAVVSRKSPSPAQLVRPVPVPVPKSNGKREPIIIEDLSSDEDSAVEKPTEDLRLKFVDGSIFIFPRESFEKNISPNSWLNDIMIDFFMDWITKECLTDEDRRNVHIFHTTFFTKLLRLKKSIAIPSNGTKAQIDQHMKFLWSRLYPRKNQLKIDYVQKDLLMIPVFWENHWLLGMIQGIKNLARDDQSEERCRIIIVDSKMNDPLNAHILPSIHHQIFELLRGYVQLVVYTQFNVYPKPKFTFIRCRNLPDQRNSYDCGLFLVRYVKTFSRSRDFLRLDDASLANIRMPQSDPLFQLSIDRDRSQMKALIENYLVR